MSPRRKQFDPDQALDRALNLFWAKGYEATSIQDLVAAMGINRFSLYDTFGDKHALFLAACARYRAMMGRSAVGALRHTASGREAIVRFFRIQEDYYASEAGRCGCLMTNALVECAPHDDAIRQDAWGFVSNLENAFYGALVRARAAGEIATREDLRQLAGLLAGVALANNVIGKAAPAAADRVRSNVRLALRLLEV
jgi:TetR/AcrR family transcriptional repressor of nem operon